MELSITREFPNRIYNLQSELPKKDISQKMCLVFLFCEMIESIYGFRWGALNTEIHVQWNSALPIENFIIFKVFMDILQFMEVTKEWINIYEETYIM